MRYKLFGFCSLIVATLLISGCGPSSSGPKPIQIVGSTTLINMAQKWAAKYKTEHPEVKLQVSGGGSGVGITGLINGTCDLADASRKMTDTEFKHMKEKRSIDAVEHVVAFDSICIYVNKQNPLTDISMEQLAEIYGEGGKITKWSDLKIKMPAGVSDNIVLVNRPTTSGTYECFHEVVLGEKRNYKSGAIEKDGSKDAVAQVVSTPSAICYCSMGYETPETKVLKVSRKTGDPVIQPNVENTQNGSYPITRPLQIYSAGEPTGVIKAYLDWIKGPEGQKIVEEDGCVPLKLK